MGEMNKINWKVNNINGIIYLNIRKEELTKLKFNHQWCTTIKVISWLMFSFASKPKADLLDGLLADL
jgi:hypothetical protein